MAYVHTVFPLIYIRTYVCTPIQALGVASEECIQLRDIVFLGSSADQDNFSVILAVPIRLHPHTSCGSPTIAAAGYTSDVVCVLLNQDTYKYCMYTHVIIQLQYTHHVCIYRMYIQPLTSKTQHKGHDKVPRVNHKQSSNSRSIP